MITRSVPFKIVTAGHRSVASCRRAVGSDAFWSMKLACKAVRQAEVGGDMRSHRHLRLRRPLVALGLTTTCVVLGGAGEAAAAGYDYPVTATITVGGGPYAVAVDSDANVTYVANFSSNNVSAINATTNTVGATIPVGPAPRAIAVDSSTHLVYVANFSDDTVSVINGSTNAVAATIPVRPHPYGVAVDPTTHTVYVTNSGGTLSVIDGISHAVTATITVGAFPIGVAVDTTTHTVYVTNKNAGTVSVINGGTRAVIGTVRVGASPLAVAVDPDTHTAYVANFDAGSVSVIDGNTRAVTATIPVGGNPAGVAVDPTSRTVFVANNVAGTVSVIGETSRAVDTTVTVGPSPRGIAVNPNTLTAYVSSTTSASVAVISQHPNGVNVDRIAGADRFATAAAVSRVGFPSAGAGAVVLASGANYPDALVGVPLAAARNAPLLLTSGATLPAVTKAEIQRVLAAGSTVYVLGSNSAIPDSIAAELTGLGYPVVRYGGADRYATAVQVADALGDPPTVLLASGINFADALSAGVAATKASAVVLLTNGSLMSSPTSSYLAAHASAVYAVGGPAAAADPNATAIVGADRYRTAVAVAQKFFADPSAVGIASGAGFPDALSGGVLLARAGGPLLLAAPTGLPAGVAAYVSAVKGTATTVHLFGGTAALSNNVEAGLLAALVS